MSEIQKELNKRTYKCIKKETGIDLADSEAISNLSIEDYALIAEHGFKCVIKVFRTLAKSKFRKWVLEEFDEYEKNANQVNERMIRFSSKIGDPVDVVQQQILQKSIIENLVEDIDDDELLSDHSSVVRLLLLSYLGELNTRLSIGALQPLLFTTGLAQAAIGKDMSWSTSMLALTTEEQFIKKKAVEFGIDIEDDEKYYKILQKLTSYLEDNSIRQSRELLLADGHRKIRNKVLHENWNPTEDEMDDIVAHVLKIVQFFSSEDFH